MKFTKKLEDFRKSGTEKKFSLHRKLTVNMIELLFILNKHYCEENTNSDL